MTDVPVKSPNLFATQVQGMRLLKKFKVVVPKRVHATVIAFLLKGRVVMAWLGMAWNSSQVLAVAFRTLTILTITFSVLIFVVKSRQDTLSAKKARAQSGFIDQQSGMIAKQEQDISTLSSRALELQETSVALSKQANNAERGISDIYDYNGIHRIRQGAKLTVIAGHETDIFRKMLDLQQSETWVELLTLCQKQIVATPAWLSPYMFAAAADINVGDVAEARRLLTHVVQHAGDDPAYGQARRLLSSLPGQAE